MDKIKNGNYFFKILLLISFFSSNAQKLKNSNEITNTQKNINYQEVVFKKNSNYKNSKIQELNISFKNYIFKLRLVDALTFMQFSVDNKILSDWKCIQYNYFYDTEPKDAEVEIKLLFNNAFNDGLIILPGFSEQYPKINVFRFDNKGISFFNNFCVDEKSFKIENADKIFNEFYKGSFTANKSKNNFIIYFKNKSKIYNVRFMTDEKLVDENNQDIQKALTKVILYEKKKK